jgi:hypothetical protein
VPVPQDKKTAKLFDGNLYFCHLQKPKTAMNTRPIVIIDDDKDDLDLIQQALAELNVENEVIFFNDGFKFLDYINTTEKNFFLYSATLICTGWAVWSLKKRLPAMSGYG